MDDWRWTTDLPAALFGRRIAVTGASMYPVLHPGDRVLFDRLVLSRRGPRRGDIALVAAPEREQRLIKLVAGLPGERVAVRQDRLWIDDRPLRFHRPMVGSLPGAWDVGPDECFLLSYAVAVGTDSRHFGPVSRAALLGRARLVYWPPARRRRLSPVPLELDDPHTGAGR